MRLRRFLAKLRGTAAGSPPRVGAFEMLWSWIGAFIGMGVVYWVGSRFLAPHDLPLMIGSFGASAVLLYGAARSPLAQPRNLLGGHAISAAIGVACWKLLQPDLGLAEATAVATSIAAMHATRTLHPPGGATALIAVIGSPDIHRLGFWFVLVPATVGPAILLAVALVINNLPASRRYPETWF
ncbi:MAG TPA: HPP family protein [Rhodocyclaceae bacterium]|nr:HPP family protein [Rhodocyclaceae bacterium]